MLVELFQCFFSVLNWLPDTEWFIGLCATGCVFFIGCLIKYIIVD